MNVALSALFVPENLASRDGFGSSPVPRQPAHLHTQAESGAYLRDSSRVPRRRPYNVMTIHTHIPLFEIMLYVQFFVLNNTAEMFPNNKRSVPTVVRGCSEGLNAFGFPFSINRRCWCRCVQIFL